MVRRFKMLQLIVEFRDVSSLKMSRGCYFPVLLFFELSVFKFKLEISLLYTRALMSLLIFGYLSKWLLGWKSLRNMISSKEASASSILTSRRELFPCFVHACSATSRTTLATKSALSNSDIGMGGALSGYGGDSCSIEFLLLRFC